MANIFQKIGQKIKDVAVGSYHAAKPGGHNFRSYVDEEERRRRLQEQQRAAQAPQSLRGRAQAALAAPKPPQDTRSNVTKLKVGGTGVGLGAVRSATGAVQAGAGLYDLASPGKGTNRVSKKADQWAQFQDQTAKAEGAGKSYKAGQLGTDILQFVTPGAAIKIAGKVSQGANAANKAAQLSRSAAAAKKLMDSNNAAARIAGKTLKGATSKENLVDVAVDAAYGLGQEASKGRDISPQDIAANVGISTGFGIGVPGGGAVVSEIISRANNRKAQREAIRLMDPSVSEGIRLADPGVPSTKQPNNVFLSEDDVNGGSAYSQATGRDGTKKTAVVNQDASDESLIDALVELKSTPLNERSITNSQRIKNIEGLLKDRRKADPGLPPANAPQPLAAAASTATQRPPTVARPSATVDQPRAYPERQPRETDQDYFQRAVKPLDKPAQLPPDHSAYFNMGKAHDVLPIEALDITPGRDGSNAAKFMAAARDRTVAKRDPIKVLPLPNGRFKVLDGNGTTAAAQDYGWGDIPVEIIKPEHWEAANGLAAAAEAANQPFQNAMKQIAERLGVTYTGGPVKQVERILEKGINDYAGDFDRVLDTVRGTMEIPDPQNIEGILAELAQAGQIERVKNGYDLYTGGYRDIKVNIITPEGHRTEIILASPEMLTAKNDMGGHELYEVVRTGNDELGEALREMEELYAMAAQAEDARLAASSADISLPSTEALSGGNGIPVASTSPTVSRPLDDTLTATSSTSKNASNGSPDDILSDSLIDSPSSSIIAKNTSAVNPDGTTRGFIETVQESPKTAPEVKAGIGGKYDPITNEQSLARAEEIIAADPEAAISRAKTEQQYGREIQAVSMRLVDQLQAAGRYDDAIDVIEATAARATEAGQATQILAAYNRLTPEGILAAAQREITNAQKLNPEKYADLKITPEQAADLRTRAEAIQAMPEGDEKRLATRDLLDEISRVVPTPGARKLTTLWKAGLLTGVKGAIGGNFVGNTASAVMRKLADVPAAAIDTVLGQIFGRRSKLFTLKGIFGGFGEGVKVGVKNFREGTGAADEAIKLDYKKVNFGKGKLGRAAQKYTESVFNFYSAADRPFYHAALANNLQELARVEARNLGLTGRDAKQFVNNLIKEPPDEILTAAVQAAEDATFKSKNALGSALTGAKQGLTNKGGAAGEIAGEILMPFTGVPAAIAKHVYEYSPGGATVQAYRAIRQLASGKFDQAAQRKLSEALGRGITGTGIMWLGTQLHKDGIMTLGWPSDPDERALWESEGKTPYSVFINGKWRSMNYMGAAMSLMAIGGQIDSAVQEGGGGLGAVASGVASSGKAIIGSTPLQGLQGGLDAITEPDRYGSRFLNNTVGSVIPTVVKDIAVATDPLQRAVNSPMDALKNRLPGIRLSLPAKTTAFGEDLPRATSAVGSIIDPFKSSQGRSTELTGEMRRLQTADLGISPPKIDKKETFDGVETELDPAMQDELKRRTNNTVQEAWAAVIGTPEYQELSDADKKKALENISGDIAAVERRKFSAEKQLGQYAPGFSGKPTKLSGKQDALLNGYQNFDPGNYLSPTGEKMAKDLSSTGKSTLVKIEAMSTDDRTDYLKDPKNNYQYELSKYENDLKNGKLTDVDQYEKLQTLGSLKVKSNYSKEAIELYGLSKTKLNDFLKKKGGVSQKVLDEVIAMDNQLAAEGFISKPKFGGGIGGSGGGGGGRGKKAKTIKVPKPNFGSFRLVDAPKEPAPTMQSVMADLNRMFADIKILQGVQVAPGDDSSKIQIAV